MKSLILFLTFVISFAMTSAAFASPPTGIFNGVPDEKPALSELSQEMGDTICKMVGVNSIVAQRNKNNGVAVDETITQYTDHYNNNSDGNAPDEVAFQISLGAIQAVYALDADISTDEEYVELGMSIYNTCLPVVEQIQWGFE
jgi:hypothetical protein